jgi:hypothetical protein
MMSVVSAGVDQQRRDEAADDADVVEVGDSGLVLPPPATHAHRACEKRPAKGRVPLRSPSQPQNEKSPVATELFDALRPG